MSKCLRIKKLWLTKTLEAQFEESALLEKAIRENLQGLEYDS
jgi:hypothetical protein